ncbi:MAG: hypothetical protein HY447_02340 [Candidatus Omnitrophica bacterium]|nr:hypothetical protein [Candidatus Omnitrophota bacterium]
MRHPLITRHLSLVIAFIFASTTLFDYGSLAFAITIGSSSTSSNNSAAQLTQISESAGPVQSFQADLFTGRAQTSIPIFIPPGRKNIQPNLNLSYSSSGGNSWLGVGWSLDLGFIQRDVKRGVPKYSAVGAAGGDKFVFSFQGVFSELVLVGANEYRARDEALFLKFLYDPATDSWTVFDKSGTKYQFGLDTGCRQSNTKGTFKWVISKVVDTVGNSMLVTHTNDGGEVYLSKIEYNGNSVQNFASTHLVEFTLEDRSDKTISYITSAKTELKKRLKEIQVKVKDSQGVWQLARKYTFVYASSSSSRRSLLTSVTECGRDGEAVPAGGGTTCLPPAIFTYTDKPKSFGTVSQRSGIQDLGDTEKRNITNSTVNGANDSFTHTDMIDINGDGLPDRVLKDSASSPNFKIQLNQTSGSFGPLQDFGPIDFQGNTSRFGWIRTTESFSQVVATFQDINGDGLPDRILSDPWPDRWKVQLNTGSGLGPVQDWIGIQNDGWSQLVNIQYSPADTAQDVRTRAEFIDMNGDGLPDRVLKKDNASTVMKVQINNGTSFNALQDWTGVDYLGQSEWYGAIRVSKSGHQTITHLQDINGDGLPDRIIAKESEPTYWRVQFNNGRSFEPVTLWGPIEYLGDPVYSSVINSTQLSGSSTSFTRADFFDVNGDGLSDRVLKQSNTATVFKVQINNGSGFDPAEDWTGIDTNGSPSTYGWIRASHDPGKVVLDSADINGDGLPDRCMVNQSDTFWKEQAGTGKVPDLMATINNGRGGKTTITYSPSTQFDNREAAPGGGADTSGKQRLPFVVQTVTQVKQEDGMGNSYITNYSYKGGVYDATDREFRGFREVAVTDAVGTKTIHTFGQTDHDKGRLLTKEVRDSSGNLFTKEVTTWEDTHPWGDAVDVHFVHVAKQESFIYDGNDTFKETRQTFTYDAYGNLATTTEEGDVSVTGDERKTVNVYVYSEAAYILNTLAKTTLYGSDLVTRLAERYFSYDTKGLLTKEQEWLSSCSPQIPDPCHPSTSLVYDSFGNLITITDARGYTTTNTYDSTYKLFLIEIKNALNHTRKFTYDPLIAQITASTDQNNQVTTTQYDALGRVTKVISPLDSSTEPTQEFSYDLSIIPNRTISKLKTSKSGETYNFLTVYSFVDGLGREIQKRSPAEDPAKQIVTGIVTFDSRGQVKEQFVPYFESFSSSYTLPLATLPHATFSYDALGRRTRVDYPDSTFSTVTFDDFVKTTTDQRGKQLRYTNDAYGRLAKVEEFNSGDTYSTTYEYDALNNLKKTTDSIQNSTFITYDSLSRKLSMTDPDMGSWSYQYDVNDNLTKQTDAKGQAISFTYDALNRVTLKDLPTGEVDVSYVYDDSLVSFSKGRLTKVTDASGTHEFTYDALGRVTSDKKTVDGTAYAFTRVYDSMSRVRSLSYPDTEVVTYTYNGMGDVEKIDGVKSSVTTSYVKEVNYNASGQITKITYGNNVTSDYTYNPLTLRLDKILTKKSDGVTKLQDLSYQFDSLGNVSHISDLVNSMTQDFTYDDLNRLIQATGSAYGTQTFQYDAIGNMTKKGNLTMMYGEGAPGPHAVTRVEGQGSSSSVPSFCPLPLATCNFVYDTNGNMTKRGNDTLIYDSENRLKEAQVYEGTTATRSYTLQPGWNLISFTYLPDDKSVTNVLKSLVFGTDYDQVSYWSPTAGAWSHFVNDPDFNDFTSFEYGKSYEIYYKGTTAKTFSVTGKSPGASVTFTAKIGDNFIGPAVKASTSVSTVLSGWVLNTDYSDVLRFNASTKVFESYKSGQFTKFDPGRGYILKSLKDKSFSYGETKQVTTFVYDSTGSRVKKQVGSTKTVYLGKDYEIEGTKTTKYIFLGDRRIVVNSKLSTQNSTLLFIHSDHINSSNVVTDSAGNKVALYEYDPYGSTATYQGTASLKHKFTGQEEDDTTKLYYYGARYYDPQLGRFITADPTVQHPTDPQDFNRYAYARNNPIIFTDPTGLGWLSKLFAFIAAAVTAVFTGGGSLLAWGAIIAAGALGGLAGAAIEKSSLAEGAINGAIIGAGVAAATAAGSGGGGSGGGGSGGGAGGADSVKIVTSQGFENSQIIEITGVADSIGTSGTSSTGKTILFNLIGSSVAYAVEPPKEGRAKETLGQKFQSELVSLGAYQSAIDFSAGYYGFSPGKYDPNHIIFSASPGVFGFTNLYTGEIVLGRLAFYSRTSLQATGFHETIHQHQVRSGKVKFNEKGELTNRKALEVSASVETLLHAKKLNLDEVDIRDESEYLADNLGWKGRY